MLKPYPKYKETPALWLNSIPNHWESHKIRELFVERSEKVSDKDYSPLSVSKAGVVPQIATLLSKIAQISKCPPVIARLC